MDFEHLQQLLDPCGDNGVDPIESVGDLVDTLSAAGIDVTSLTPEQLDQVLDHLLGSTLDHGLVGLPQGYYNADGTYHYSSDNADRDPVTGAIVRRW
jgi:hypothetical protein